MTSQRTLTRVASKAASAGDETQELIDYCARPLCRAEFRRQAGPGRRQSYCSELCRRTAEKQARQTRSRLAHFEGVVEQLRTDVAAFGRSVDDDAADEGTTSIQERRRAENAVNRAGGILDFTPDAEEPLVRELRALYDAVAPLVGVTRVSFA